jgi:hypothetical protein
MQPTGGGSTIVADASSQRTPISSGIYGVAFASAEDLQIASLNRWGGDATTSYNWQNDAYNSGTDWYCANYTWSYTAVSPDPSLKTATDQLIHDDVSKQVDTLMTVPITGWVASMPTPYSALQSHPECAGAYGGTGGDQQKCCAALSTTYDTLVDKGSSVLDTSFVSNWVQHLKSTFGPAASGGVKYYQLDNEPDNWQALRKDVYPALYPPGNNCEPFYSTHTSIGKSLDQDFRDRTIAYAKAVKGADASARVLFMSTENAWDLVALPNNECGNPAGPYSNNNSLTQALLKLAAAEEQKNGTRLLDCVDMHYPFPGAGLGDTRALWDPTFTQYNTPVIPPHIQGWINGTYPGTGTCISEYNVPHDGGDGNAPDPSTAAQLADIFGMYGRLGYQVAAYWGSFVHQGVHLPIYNALAMYRNYDGMGGKFGAYSVGAASSSSSVNVYAASDSPTSPSKVWVMLVNVSGANQSALSLNVRNFAPSGTASVYRADANHAPAAGTPVAIAGGNITGLSLPSNSLALLVMSR